MTAHALVMAKVPVAGQVKTRLGVDIGMAEAAEVAGAALLDTLGACKAAFGAERCHLALVGDLSEAGRRKSLYKALAGWDVYPQQGADFATRLCNAHLTLAKQHCEPVVQIGMDTPQVTAALLRDAAAALDVPERADAVLGPTPDGGWWVLSLRDPRTAHVLRRVAMSTPTTHDDTRSALTNAGLVVAATRSLRDVDTVVDAEAVADTAPSSAFTRSWQAVTRRSTAAMPVPDPSVSQAPPNSS
jgi:uncharacterized protein